MSGIALSVHDAESSVDPGAPDADVFAAAQAEGLVLVTENVRDYRPLESAVIAGGSQHAGLVYTSDRGFPRGDPATPGRPAQALDALLREGQELRRRSVFLRPVVS